MGFTLNGDGNHPRWADIHIVRLYHVATIRRPAMYIKLMFCVGNTPAYYSQCGKYCRQILLYQILMVKISRIEFNSNGSQLPRIELKLYTRL